MRRWQRPQGKWGALWTRTRFQPSLGCLSKRLPLLLASVYPSMISPVHNHSLLRHQYLLSTYSKSVLHIPCHTYSLHPKLPRSAEHLLWASSVLGAGASVAKTQAIGPCLQESQGGCSQTQIQLPSWKNVLCRRKEGLVGTQRTETALS